MLAQNVVMHYSRCGVYPAEMVPQVGRELQISRRATGFPQVYAGIDRAEKPTEAGWSLNVHARAIRRTGRVTLPKSGLLSVSTEARLVLEREGTPIVLRSHKCGEIHRLAQCCSSHKYHV